jgi:hypothetical protein
MAKQQQISVSLVADYRTCIENQQPDKHVEVISVSCLDAGSTPASSTRQLTIDYCRLIIVD